MLRSDDVDKGAKRTEHENRFDRQLRLWGGHGQKLLESTHICALGSGPAVAETLKNLVLPNIGKITIVDDVKVSEEDNGNNFFVAEEDIGKPRGAVVTANLLEMNPWDEKKNFGVQGFHIDKNPDKMVAEEVEEFGKYNIIVASGITDASVLKLSSFCYKKNITFVLLRVNGLIGYIRWTKREHCIAEAHPDAVDTTDIRIFPEQLKYFPELEAYIKEFDFKQLRNDKRKHGHIPWPVIVHTQLQEWIQKKGAIPKNFKERSEFKTQIRESALKFFSEQNFQEAVKMAHKACMKPELEFEAQQCMDDPKAQKITADTEPFWVIMHALNAFKREEGKGWLPVNATIPDMTSLPEHYVKLQKIFKARELRDLDAVRKHVRAALKSVGKPENAITDDEIDRVAKHVRTCAVIRTSSLEQAYDAKKADPEEINEIFEEWEEPIEWDEEEMGGPPPFKPKNIYWYFALRAAERFRAAHGRYPGTPGSCDVEADTKMLVEIQKKMFEEYKIRAKVEEGVLGEVVRFGAKEIHNTAAMIGGVASQLCLKLCINQFSPFDNTFVFNGIHSTSNVYKL